MGGANVDGALAGARALAEAFVPFLLTALAVVFGLGLVFHAVYRLYKKGAAGSYGQQQNLGWGQIAGQLLIGGLALRFASTMQDVSQLLFGRDVEDIRGVLAYAPIAQQSQFWNNVLEVCLLWVVMLGWAGAFRGLLLWNDGVSGDGAGGGGNYGWRGFWHIAGGAAAVNLSGAINSFFGR